MVIIMCALFGMDEKVIYDGISAIDHNMKYHFLIQNTNIGIITFFEDGSYNEINSCFCGITGYEKHEIHNTKFPEPFWPPQFYDRVEEEVALFKKIGVLKTETFLKKRNDMFFPVTINGSMIRGPKSGKTEYILFIEDISDRKQAERELQLSQEMLVAINSKLEDMVKDRTKKINELIARKNDFINQLGHDLKNPLNPLINLTPILEEKIIDNEGKEILKLMKNNVFYMKDLIVRTISLAKLNSPDITFNFTQCNLVKEINSIIENNTFSFDKNDINLQTNYNTDPVVDIDKLRFNELLVNIFDNAVKYSPDGGTITVTVDELEQDQIQIKITDQGKGMNQDQLAHVFDDFYRAHQTDNTFKSSGLGMSICKRIVEKHNGTIHCDSPGIDKGTTITIILPRSQHNTFQTKINETDEIELVIDALKDL